MSYLSKSKNTSFRLSVAWNSLGAGGFVGEVEGATGDGVIDGDGAVDGAAADGGGGAGGGGGGGRVGGRRRGAGGRRRRSRGRGGPLRATHQEEREGEHWHCKQQRASPS